MFIGILVLDRASSHSNEIILEFLKNNGNEYCFILGGLTSKIQHNDISVNKVFKVSYKNIH